MAHGDPRMALLISTHPSARERIDYLARAGIERLPIPTASAEARTVRFNRLLRTVLVK